MNNKNRYNIDDFEPSLKIINRIIKCLIKNGAETKTTLSRNTNINYTRLVKHVVWMEKKGLIKSVITDLKIHLILTDKGIKLASEILDI